MIKSKLKLNAVIFDLDGTLIDSVGVYVRAMEEILGRLGLPPVSKESLLDNMRSNKGDWGDLFPGETRERKATLAKEAMEIFREISPRVFREDIKPIPGIAGTMKQLAADGIKIGLVTSTHKKYLNGKLYPLKQLGVMDLLEAVIGIEDIPNPKPAPDPLVECANRMGVSPGMSLCIGDSCTDIIAGNAAGMNSVGVLTGIDDFESLIKVDPYTILNSVVELSKIIQ